MATNIPEPYWNPVHECFPLHPPMRALSFGCLDSDDNSRQAPGVIVGLWPISMEFGDGRYLDSLLLNCTHFSELREEVMDEMRKSVHELLRSNLASDELDMNVTDDREALHRRLLKQITNEQHIEKG